MLRLHFTAEDLLRTRFASRSAPMVELCLVLAALQGDGADPVLGRWRRRLRADLPRDAAPLLELIPPGATGPLFLDPVSDGMEDGLDTVLSSPHPYVRAELERVSASGRPVTPLMRGLADRDRDAWRVVEHGMRTAYASMLAPAWPRLRAGFHADLAWRSRLFAEVGLEETLAGLFPGGRWRGTVLEFDVPVEQEFRLEGRGVTLMPSALWSGRPLVGDCPDGSALVLYPGLTPLPLVEPPPPGDGLVALLGRTRAAVLRLLVDPHTTSALARHAGISAATASEHAKVLRTAGLVVTERAGKSVLHRCTPLGLRLLADTGPPLGGLSLPGGGE